MAPLFSDKTTTIRNHKSNSNDIHVSQMDHLNSDKTDKSKWRVAWASVIRLLILHAAAIYGILLIRKAHVYTWIWTISLYWMSCFGITAGAHRLWSHRSYKAKTPLRVLLAVFQTLALQNDIIEWVRDHRVHHKFSETDSDPHNAKRGFFFLANNDIIEWVRDHRVHHKFSETNADPHNAKRGFFFAHCGWLMVRKHPDVKRKGQAIDMSDVLNDPVCAFQRKVYLPASILICFIIPSIIPWYLWNESIRNAYFISGVLRCVIVLHLTWFVNSAAHMWGTKPYDKGISPSENMFVTIGAGGEGFHNYHHTFPHDYAAGEFGKWFNPTTIFIDLMAAIGQVTHRNKMKAEVIAKRRLRTGNGRKED